MDEAFVPEEINSLFSDKKGKGLLVKRLPGSGKSCFALTLRKDGKKIVSCPNCGHREADEE